MFTAHYCSDRADKHHKSYKPVREYMKWSRTNNNHCKQYDICSDHVLDLAFLSFCRYSNVVVWTGSPSPRMTLCQTQTGLVSCLKTYCFVLASLSLKLKSLKKVHLYVLTADISGNTSFLQ